MFFPNESILLFFFRPAGENISEPKEEQQNELFGETYQQA
jgi:hypothetical protein